MPFRNIRFRASNSRSTDGATGGYSVDDVRKIASLGIDYAVKQIVSELVCDDVSISAEAQFSFNTLAADQKLFLYLLELNPVLPVDIASYTSVVGTSIKQGKTILTDFVSSQAAGVSSDLLDKIHYNSVSPFLEVSPVMGGSAQAIDSLITEFDQAMENGCGNLNIMRSLKDLLLVLKEGKLYYIEYLKEKRKAEEVMNALDKMAFKVRCLEQILAEVTTNNTFQSGHMSMKVNKPKPAIYALAIFDLYEAWYRFLFPGTTIDNEKLHSVIDYVMSVGTEEEGRLELYNILDVVFKDPLCELSSEPVALEDNPYRGWIPKHENWEAPGIPIHADPDYKSTTVLYDNVSSSDESGHLRPTVYDKILKYVNVGNFEGALVLQGSVCLKKTKLEPANVCLSLPCNQKSRRKKVRCRTTFKKT
jgi:hypothetical protein